VRASTDSDVRRPTAASTTRARELSLAGRWHANIGVTMDRYGHLMPGAEAEAAALADAYPERANALARAATTTGLRRNSAAVAEIPHR